MKSSLDAVSSIMEGLENQLSGPQSKLVASVSSVLYDRGKEYRERERNVNRRAEQLKTEAKQQAWTEVEKKLTEISIQDTNSDQYLINLWSPKSSVVEIVSSVRLLLRMLSVRSIKKEHPIKCINYLSGTSIMLSIMNK